MMKFRLHIVNVLVSYSKTDSLRKLRIEILGCRYLGEGVRKDTSHIVQCITNTCGKLTTVGIADNNYKRNDLFYRTCPVNVFDDY